MFWESGPPAWWLNYHGLATSTRAPAPHMKQQPQSTGRGFRSAQSNDTVHIEGEVVLETDKAVQFLTVSGVECWLPRSQIELVPDGVLIPSWLAKKNDLAQ